MRCAAGVTLGGRQSRGGNQCISPGKLSLLSSLLLSKSHLVNALHQSNNCFAFIELLTSIILSRNVRFGPKLCPIDLKWDKSGTFKDQFQ